MRYATIGILLLAWGLLAKKKAQEAVIAFCAFYIKLIHCPSFYRYGFFHRFICFHFAPVYVWTSYSLDLVSLFAHKR